MRHRRTRYRYDPRVAITGLVIGMLILAVGLLTGHPDVAGALAMATVISSASVASIRVPDRPADPDGRERARRG
jgi:hypothetical protein